jgi:dihydropteroate synthase
MRVRKLSNSIDVKRYLKDLGVDGGGVNILASKAKRHIIYVKDLHVGAANILKQDALSIGADLAVPRGTVLAITPKVDCILIATGRELEILAKKELAQPFGLKELAKELQKICKVEQAKKVQIMGVINANDDSFFSGSRFKGEDAIAKITRMIEDGADVIDIGGVSSKPNAAMVSASEELERLRPILQAIKQEKLYESVRFSVDSYEPSVIASALDSGFSVVNDITGLANDEVCKLCASYDATVVIMHMLGTPQTMQDDPTYSDVLDDVYDFLQERANKAEAFGVKDVILDVGVGFGKTLEDNLRLIKHLERFATLEKPLLVGASRKSMIDKISSCDVKDRLGGTLALHLEAVRNGASMLRVHDVYEHKQALLTYEALLGV